MSLFYFMRLCLKSPYPFLNAFRILFECRSNIVRKKDADLFSKRVRPFSKKMPTFSKSDADGQLGNTDFANGFR